MRSFAARTRTVMPRVEVVYALPYAQEIVAVELEPGATVADAIRMSGLAGRHATLRSGAPAVGIHGKVVAPEQVLADGDRVEIYRPLVADPKAARRQRAKRG